MKTCSIPLPRAVPGIEYIIHHIESSNLHANVLKGYGITPGTKIKLLFKICSEKLYKFYRQSSRILGHIDIGRYDNFPAGLCYSFQLCQCLPRIRKQMYHIPCHNLIKTGIPAFDMGNICFLKAYIPVLSTLPGCLLQHPHRVICSNKPFTFPGNIYADCSGSTGTLQYFI